MDNKKFALICIVVVCFCNYGDSLKILVIPMNMGSHLMFMGQAGSALAEKGHEVVMYIPDNNKRPQGISPKVRHVLYKSPLKVAFSSSEDMTRIEVEAVLTESTLEWMGLMEEMKGLFVDSLEKECESLHTMYPAIEGESFDLALMDGALFNCFYTMPYKLGIPYVSISWPYMMWNYRIPHHSSQWPGMMTPYNDTMNFWQRLSNFGMDLMDVYLTASNDTTVYCKKFAPEREPKGDGTLMSESAMWWHLYDISIGYPKPNMPNMLDVGDMMARPALPLPKEYADIMNESSEKVILMSLGSYFDHVPTEWLQKLCDTFSEIKYTVIWKLKVSLPCKPSKNVQIKKWVPQNDLLAHPKLALFITHCGLNSVIESVSNGKPMVGLPIAVDQPYNCKMVETKGYGKVLNLKTFVPNELAMAVGDVIENKVYAENARKGSEIMRNKVTTQGERMSFWAEHIVKFGDSHLRTKAHNLSLAEFLMVDIFAFLFLCALIFVIMFILFVLCCAKCCKRLFCAKGVKQKSE